MATSGGSGSGVKSIGGLLPRDFLDRLSDGKRSVSGTREASYGLADNERLGEIITRSWNRLTDAWQSFSQRLSEITDTNETARALTRDKWLNILFSELNFGRLPSAPSFEVGGIGYGLSNLWQGIPIHLVGARTPLDKRSPGVRGAAGMSPHALVQEILNRSEDYLWGIVSNGLLLRLLRDNASLTRQSYLEFDLEVIFANERYEEFVTLWMVCHQSRFNGQDPAQSWLEKWRGEVADSGVRALDALRGGVEHAIESLGRGFISHPDNKILVSELRSGELSGNDFYREVLRLVYRILFLFVAEDRDLLLSADVSPSQRERYIKWYSTKRLRDLSWGVRSRHHHDMWQLITIIMEGLGKESGITELGISPLGSYLWSTEAISHLSKCQISNDQFGEALIHLSTTTSEGVRRGVDFANLGAEELGSVYESLLELYPQINVDHGSFELKSSAGNERKTSGSYYTPTELVVSLLETALDPVLERAAKKDHPEEAILSLKIIDPACGSGHFLIAAAHRIAERLAQIRCGEPEAPPSEVRRALREVVARCCYGIDINPMAVELAKVSLWMEAMEPGKPLTFLERHIVVGNALLGTTPALIRGGVPDGAYSALDGDDKSVLSATKKENKKIRDRGIQTLNLEIAISPSVSYTDQVVAFEKLPDDNIKSIENKANLWREIKAQVETDSAKLAADAWCAAFVYEKVSGGISIDTETIRNIQESGVGGISESSLKEIKRLAQHNQFLHLHIAFPEVFQVSTDVTKSEYGWSGGFDVVLGNPPWEKVKLSEKEFFSVLAPEITMAKGAKRKAIIKALEVDDPALSNLYRGALRKAGGESSYLIRSGRYPLTGRGDINTYAVFTELALSSISTSGRVGLIVPTGIATDDTTSDFFGEISDRRSLASLFDFENAKPIFPGVHRSYKFSILTMTGRSNPAKDGAEFVFFAHEMGDLKEEDRKIRLSADEIRLFNPNTRTTPIFRHRSDAELAKQVYERVPVLIEEGPPEINPWGIRFKTLFHMTNNSDLFMTRVDCESTGAKMEGNVFVKPDGTKLLPLYEGKMIHHFDHSFATYDGSGGDKTNDVTDREKQDPTFAPLPRYWVAAAEVDQKLAGWGSDWLIGFRDIARSTDVRTLIATIVPKSAFANTVPTIIPQNIRGSSLACFLGCVSSFALDAITRMKVGGTHMTYFIIKQLPILPPSTFAQVTPWKDDQNETLAEWIAKRVVELTYTASDMKPWAEELGYFGPVFEYNDERRRIIRAELDACFFHLYGYRKEQVEYAMGTFPILKRNDEAKFGRFLTKELILEFFDKFKS